MVSPAAIWLVWRTRLGVGRLTGNVSIQELRLALLASLRGRFCT